MSRNGQGPGAAGMAADEPWPPYGTPAFKRYEARLALPSLTILMLYLGTYRQAGDEEPCAEAVAVEMATLRPSDVPVIVDWLRKAEAAFGDPAPGRFPPKIDRWRAGALQARPVMLQLCPPEHRDGALIMLDQRIAVEASDGDLNAIDARSEAQIQYPVGTIHAEAALRSWMFTQPDLLRAGLKADAEITQYLLGKSR